MSAPLRILVADDHAFLREALAVMIRDEGDMEVVAQAGDGDAAVARARELRPDVAIVDLTMPSGGIRTLKRIRAECPATRLLVLTMHDDPALLRSVLRAGGHGYVTKSAASRELIQAIRLVAAGRQYINVLFDQESTGATELEAAPDPAPPELSARELQVLVAVARGYTSKEIAEELQISSAAVDSYRLRLSRKIGARGRVDLVDYALRLGLLRSRDSDDA